MTDLRKAAEMALEALDSYPLPFQVPAKEALRQALAEPANSTTDFVEPKASSQPEQEPVAWGFQNTAITGSNRWMYLRETIPADDQYRGVLWTPLYTAPPKQEYQYEVVAEHANGTYTTKRIPKREWVGLTDEEIYDYADKFLYQHGSNYGIKSFGKAIESTLKKKNA